MKRLVNLVVDFGSRPIVLGITLPICIFAIRLAYAKIPTASAPDRFFELVQGVMMNDPKPGIESGIRPSLLGKPTIVVYLSKCECNHKDIVQAQKYQTSNVEVRIMMPPGSDGKSLRKTFSKHLDQILFDEGSVIGANLNIGFVPRVFVVDKDGRLVWMHDRYESDWTKLIPEAISYARSHANEHESS